MPIDDLPKNQITKRGKLDGNNEVKLGDFGLSRGTQDSTVGDFTPIYGAREVFLGTMVCASDIYSAGIL